MERKKIITAQDYYNPQGVDNLNELLYCVDGKGKATGFTNLNKSKYGWDKKYYEAMRNADWTMEEVNTSEEATNFALLSYNEQNVYKYTFGQLSFNDSLQTSYLLDFAVLVNNKITRDTIAHQASTELLHSSSYATLLDAAGNSEEIFNLYKVDDMLSLKNERIAQMFAKYINVNNAEDMTMSAVASVCLEGIFFLTGFAFINVMGDKIPGARDTISYISRDESIHLKLFANITKVLMVENNQIGKAKIIDKIYAMMNDAVEIELQYALYLIRKFPITGLTEELIKTTVWNFANDRLTAIGLKPIYKHSETTSLQKLVTRGMNPNNTRTNFFEGNNRNYSKQEVDMDF